MEFIVLLCIEFLTCEDIALGLCIQLLLVSSQSTCNSHDWSELLCRVHKRGCQGLGAIYIEMHSQARASGCKQLRVSIGLLGRPPSLEQSERRCLLFVMVWW